MLVISHDAERVIDVLVHTGDALSVRDVDAIVASVERAERLVREDPSKTSVVLLLIETDHGPDAAQRRRIAQAAAKLPRSVEVLVTTSAITRAIMTAIRWLVPTDRDHVRRTFATCDEAVAFLAEETGHPRAAFDQLVARARGELAVETRRQERARSRTSSSEAGATTMSSAEMSAGVVSRPKRQPV